MATPKGKVTVPTGLSDEFKALAIPTYVINTVAGFVGIVLDAAIASKRVIYDFITHKAYVAPVTVELDTAIMAHTGSGGGGTGLKLGTFTRDGTGAWSYEEAAAGAITAGKLGSLLDPQPPTYTPVALLGKLDSLAQSPDELGSETVSLIAYADQDVPGNIDVYQVTPTQAQAIDADAAGTEGVDAVIVIDPSATGGKQWLE